jgi:hypothetical protein
MLYTCLGIPLRHIPSVGATNGGSVPSFPDASCANVSFVRLITATLRTTRTSKFDEWQDFCSSRVKEKAHCDPSWKDPFPLSFTFVESYAYLNAGYIFASYDHTRDLPLTLRPNFVRPYPVSYVNLPSLTACVLCRVSSL